MGDVLSKPLPPPPLDPAAPAFHQFSSLRLGTLFTQDSSLCVSPAENPSVAPSPPRTEAGLSYQPAEAGLFQTLPPSLTTHAPSCPLGHPICLPPNTL